MSSRVKSPTQGGGAGFLWGILAIVVIAAVVIGYIVINGKKSDADLGIKLAEPAKVAFSVEQSDTAITLKAQSPHADAKHLEIYEDFSCPHCGELATASDAKIKEKVEAGDVVLTMHPLHFLDRKKTDGHSHKALAAAWTVASSGDASLYWAYRTTLLEHMNEIYNKWDNNSFAEAAKQLGASEDIVQQIKDGTNMDKAQDIGQSNADKLEKETGSLSSPRIFVNDKEFDLTKSKGLDSWLDEALATQQK